MSFSTFIVSIGRFLRRGSAALRRRAPPEKALRLSWFVIIHVRALQRNKKIEYLPFSGYFHENPRTFPVPSRKK